MTCSNSSATGQRTLTLCHDITRFHVSTGLPCCSLRSAAAKAGRCPRLHHAGRTKDLEVDRNIIDPVALVDAVGTDAVRYYLCAISHFYPGWRLPRSGLLRA